MEKRQKTDRRVKSTNFKRRKRNRRQGVYYYDRQAYLTDTNFFQNVYFAQYMDFIGEAREDFFRELIGEHFQELVASGISISTVDVKIKYHQELYLYDNFRIEVRITKLGRVKTCLNFIFKRDKTIVAESNMNICFKMNGKPTKTPDLVKARLIELNMIK